MERDTADKGDYSKTVLVEICQEGLLLFEEADYKESDNNVTVITIRGSAWESTSGSQRGGGSAEWKKQLRRVFGNCLPPFPPKYYLAMTTSMANERRDQLEHYLQNVTVDPNMLRSDVFVDFLKRVQLDTFGIAAKTASLDILLPDGRSIEVEILTSDTAERVLEVVSHKLGLCRELLGYFGLFLIRFCKEGKLSVMKKLADFELPYVSLRSSELEDCKVGLRKWYMDPSLDSMLMDCRAAVNLIYMQAIQDIQRGWAKPTQAQRQKLEALQEEDKQTKFLELSREVRHYGYVQLDPCTCDYPEPGCGAVLSVGNNEISCCVTLPDSQTQQVVFQLSRVKCWQVTFLGTLLDMDGPQRTLNQNLELRFQYSEDSRWQWFVLYTKQAFLLSSCLKKMISEKMVKLAAENPEMQIEVPEQGRSRKYHSQQSQQKDYSSFLPRTSKMKVAEGDCVSGTTEEEGL
ncbi:sorting nexin-31 [Eptesicus fuscus]|uniref:sorting nexin-31 n=1 Tax=Eptesicus fuscus TaxID=29078 RepID=UPI002403D87A|nr:sorting nexin-31 [Eptesicus fuscus]